MKPYRIGTRATHFAVTLPEGRFVQSITFSLRRGQPGIRQSSFRNCPAQALCTKLSPEAIPLARIALRGSSRCAATSPADRVRSTATDDPPRVVLVQWGDASPPPARLVRAVIRCLV